MKTCKVFILSILVWCNALFCFPKGVGSSAGQTLLMPLTAKVAGMSEAMTAESGDVAVINYNPAGLYTLDKLEVTSMYQKGFAEDTTATIIAGKKLFFGGLAASLRYFNTGIIEMFDTDGREISKVGQRDVIVTVGIGKEVFADSISFGCALKSISSEIFGNKTQAFALDAGVQKKDVLPHIDAGLSVQNLGTKMTYVNEKEDLPLTVRSGISYSASTVIHQYHINFDIPYMVNEEEASGRLGIEYIYNNLLIMRGGYAKSLSDASREDDQNISLGLGLKLGNYSIDYALGISDNLSNPQYISLHLNF